MAPAQSLRITLGQHSRAGRKAVNQDFHGAAVPTGALLHRKGIAIAIADGIGSSAVSQVASAAAVRSFLDDYLDTSEAWTVRRCAQRVRCAEASGAQHPVLTPPSSRVCSQGRTGQSPQSKIASGYAGSNRRLRRQLG